MHEPSWQICALTQTSHALPPRPHTACSVPNAQVPSAMQQPAQLVGPQFSTGSGHPLNHDKIDSKAASRSTFMGGRSVALGRRRVNERTGARRYAREMVRSEMLTTGPSYRP